MCAAARKLPISDDDILQRAAAARKTVALGGRKGFCDDLTVMDLPTGEHDVQRPPLAIDPQVDFDARPALTYADRLAFLLSFVPLDVRSTFAKLLSITCTSPRDCAAN